MARRRYRRRTPLTTHLFRLILVVLVAAVGYALYAKWRVETTVTDTLDGWASQLTPFGQLRYLGVSAGFDGTLAINGLSFYPNDNADVPPLITERIRIRFPDFLALTGIRPSGLPDSLMAEATGVRLDAGLQGRSISGNPFEALACDEVDEFTALDLEQMGFGAPDANVRASYRVMGDDRIQLALTQVTGDFASVDIDLELQLPGIRQALRNRRPPAPSGGMVGLVGASLTLDADAFNRARNAYCGELLGTAPLQAVDANVAATAEFLRSQGLDPDPDLLDAYHGFLSGTGALTLTLSPEPMVTLETLGELGVIPLLERLDATMTVGERQAVAVTFQAYEPPPDPAELADQEVIATERRTGQWQTMGYEDLGRYINRPVRIDTRQFRRYEGQLVGIDDNEVRISTRVPGGTAVVPIARNKIAEIQIYVRRQ